MVKRLITKLTVHNLTSVTVSFCTLIIKHTKSHPKICLLEKKKKFQVTVFLQAYTHTDTQIMFLVKTFQLNLSQTNSVGAELLVVDENCAANRLTL